MKEKQLRHIQRLANNFEKREIELEDDAQKIRFKRNLNIEWIIRFMASSMAHRALHSYFLKNDLQKFRQDFYTAALLDLGGASLDSPLLLEPPSSTTPRLLFALFSDNEYVIKKYSGIKGKRFDLLKNKPTDTNLKISMIQSAMGKRDDELLEYISITRKLRSKIERERGKSNFLIARSSPMEDFFEALLLRDKERLQTLVQKHYTNNAKDAIFEDLLSVDGCIRTKLCWRRGIEIRPISPLIPLDLMPIEPLEHYRYEYDFLEPGWTPPRQGWLGDFERFIKRKLATLHR